MKITKENLLKNGFKQINLGADLEYSESFANDCEIYFDRETKEVLFEDSGFTLHTLNVNSVEDIQTFINFLKIKKL